MLPFKDMIPETFFKSGTQYGRCSFRLDGLVGLFSPLDGRLRSLEGTDGHRCSYGRLLLNGRDGRTVWTTI
ncbi:hypothetical protein BpHYR1_004314 [Brachionus plicatilis]|uniref:Uncharacterized protein n=1 Tax=Brachionus plicatilis TaxID=10195 RepID=A0A3M7QTB1_BRAPC|nr:hypothetical protein BpHYR1_004314 [Brachionus plicatilis]